MPSNKFSQSGKGSTGDVFSTFLDTMREVPAEAEETPPDEAQLALLRLLKVFGPQKLEKLQAMAGSDPSKFFNTVYQLAEEKRIEISPDPDPNEAEVKITPEGEAFLTAHK